MKGRWQTTEIGREARCIKCGEFWPADLEFFYFKKGVPHSWCKACYTQWKRERRKDAKNETANAA
jgi:hypothetical protein